MLIFSEHALEKLAQRRIQRDLVERAAREPDHIFPSYGGRQIAYKKFGQKYLKVVFIKQGIDMVIVTQHWDPKFNPANI